jgi:hypothetical protein
MAASGSGVARERLAMRVTGDAVPGVAEVGADFVEHLVVGVPADDADIERRLTHAGTS